MKLYHGSPVDLKIIEPQQAKGLEESENKKAIYLTDTFLQAALYALGKSLKGKTAFALPPGKLVIVGDLKPATSGFVYEVDVDAEKGVRDQYAYFKPIKEFKKTKVFLKDYKKNLVYVKTKDELKEFCK